MAKPKIIDRDRGWNRIRRTVEAARRKPHVQVGIFGSEAAADHGGLPNVLVAAVHEFGTDTVPERSFIRATVDEQTRKIITAAKSLQARVLDGTSTTRQALEILGQLIQGEIRGRISRGIPPPLKPETIRRKGSSKPLIDTGQLRASIDYKVNGT